MPTYVVNTAIILLVPNDPHYSAASFCPTWVIESSNADPVDTYVEAGNCLAQFWDGVRGVVSEEAFYWLTNWRAIAGGWPFVGLDDSQSLTPFGTAEGIAPYYQTLMVKKKTGTPPRYWKGRAYIPFIGGEWAGETLCNPAAPALVACANAFVGSYTDGATTLTSVKPVEGVAEWEPIGAAEISQFIAFQRRRNISKRYYTYP